MTYHARFLQRQCPLDSWAPFHSPDKLPGWGYARRAVSGLPRKEGRLLMILYTGQRGKIRVVTAYEMTKAQQ